MKTVFLAVPEAGISKLESKTRKGMLWGKVLKSVTGEELRCVNLVAEKGRGTGPKDLGRDVMLAGSADIVAFENGWESSGRLRCIHEAAEFFQKEIIEL